MDRITENTLQFDMFEIFVHGHFRYSWALGSSGRSTWITTILSALYFM